MSTLSDLSATQLAPDFLLLSAILDTTRLDGEAVLKLDTFAETLRLRLDADWVFVLRSSRDSAPQGTVELTAQPPRVLPPVPVLPEQPATILRCLTAEKFPLPRALCPDEVDALVRLLVPTAVSYVWVPLRDQGRHDKPLMGAVIAVSEADREVEWARIESAIGHAVKVVAFQVQYAAVLESLARALTTALDERDRYTAGHSHRVAEFVDRILDHLLVADRATVRRAALLHDVGKIGIRETILNKRGKLDDTEYAEMKTHAELGVEILQHVPGLDDVLPLVRFHHEKLNGQGYPLGLDAARIPYGAKIIAVADSYHAMTSDRPYRKADTDRVVALAELIRCSNHPVHGRKRRDGQPDAWYEWQIVESLIIAERDPEWVPVDADIATCIGRISQELEIETGIFRPARIRRFLAEQYKHCTASTQPLAVVLIRSATDPEELVRVAGEIKFNVGKSGEVGWLDDGRRTLVLALPELDRRTVAPLLAELGNRDAKWRKAPNDKLSLHYGLAVKGAHDGVGQDHEVASAEVLENARVSLDEALALEGRRL